MRSCNSMSCKFPGDIISSILINSSIVLIQSPLHIHHNNNILSFIFSYLLYNYFTNHQSHNTICLSPFQNEPWDQSSIKILSYRRHLISLLYLRSLPLVTVVICHPKYNTTTSIFIFILFLLSNERQNNYSLVGCLSSLNIKDQRCQCI